MQILALSRQTRITYASVLEPIEKLTPSPLIRNHTSEEFFVRLALVNQQNAIIIYDYIVAHKKMN